MLLILCILTSRTYHLSQPQRARRLVALWPQILQQPQASDDWYPAKRLLYGFISIQKNEIKLVDDEVLFRCWSRGLRTWFNYGSECKQTILSTSKLVVRDLSWNQKRKVDVIIQKWLERPLRHERTRERRASKGKPPSPKQSTNSPCLIPLKLSPPSQIVPNQPLKPLKKEQKEENSVQKSSKNSTSLGTGDCWETQHYLVFFFWLWWSVSISC